LDVFFGFDQPFINDSPWSASGYFIYAKNDLENYFGAGESSLERLSFPGSDQTFKKFDDYEKARDQVTNGQTWARYDSYRKNQFALITNLEYSFMGGRLRPLVGLQASKIRVGDYTGEIAKGGIQQETRLREETREGKILGFDGGWNNLIWLGLTYDTRDFEPDPNSGVLARVLVQGSSEFWGSEFDFGQITTAISYFHDLLPEQTRLVFAGNLVYASRFGDVPFYALPSLSVPNDELRQGLGGFNTVEGYLNNRFIGDASVYANVELRWSFNDFMVWDEHIRLMLAPFAGGGRVFDDVGNTTLDDWKYGGGLGLRLAWNLSTVVSFNLAATSEGNVFYMELGHPF
jgi:outer membrane protein assembly factor BamA